VSVIRDGELSEEKGHIAARPPSRVARVEFKQVEEPSMSKFVTAWCCLMLAGTPLAIAQGTSTGSKPAPTSNQEKVTKALQCAAKAQNNKLTPGSPAAERYMAECLKE
jgi:hypothetical protein